MANKNFARKRLATAQSLGADFTTELVNIDNMDKVAWTISTASVTANTGTFSAQVRDKDPVTNQTGDWINISFSPTPTLVNTDTTMTCMITETAWSEARLKFVASSGVAASVVIQDLTYTADNTGGDGNSISVQYLNTGTAGSEIVTVTGSAIVVRIQSGVSTATQIKAAVDGSAAAAALVNVTISGTGSNAQTTQGPTSLSGGTPNGSAQIWVKAERKG